MKRSPILFVVAAILLLSACNSKNKSGLFIPKDAAIVFHVNSSSLSGKLSWEEIKKTTWFKDAYAEASNDSFAQKLMDNPDASGVDTKGNFVFFMQRKGRGGISVFEGGIKDAAAFEALGKKISHSDKTEKDGEWNMITMDNTSVVAWNSSKFAVINDMPDMGQMNPMSRGMGERKSYTADSLKIFVKQIMTLDDDASLYEDDRFADMVKENGDMHLWMNSSALYADMAGMMSMMKVGSLFEGNISASVINFDDGKITMKSKQYFGKEMQKMLEKFDSRKVDAAALNRISSQNIIGVIAMNFDPQSVKEFLKAMGLDGFMNMMMAEQQFTMDDVFTATKGQFIIALTDLQMKDTTVVMEGGPGEKAMTITDRKPDMNILFATNVNQKASFEKLLNIVKEKAPVLPFTYQLNNDWFVASNKPEVVNGFMSNTNTKHPFSDRISGHSFGMYVDFQKLLKTNFTTDSATNGFLAEAAAVWQDMVATGGEYKNGFMTTECVINLVDGKTNSLKQMNLFLEKMNAVRKSNKVVFEGDDRRMDGDTIDAIVAPPAVEKIPAQ